MEARVQVVAGRVEAAIQAILYDLTECMNELDGSGMGGYIYKTCHFQEGIAGCQGERRRDGLERCSEATDAMLEKAQAHLRLLEL